MKTAYLIAVAVLLSVSGCVTRTEVREISADVSETLSAYEPTGDTLKCVNTRDLRSFKVVDESLILAELPGGKMLLNQPTQRCSGASGPSRFVEFTSRSGRLCQGDTIRIIHDSLTSAQWSCSLGEFQVLGETPPAQ